MSGWAALVFPFPAELEDTILLALQEAGTLGVHVREEPGGTSGAAAPEPGSVRIAMAYFPDGTDLRPLQGRLESLSEVIRASPTEVADGLWTERQEQERRPIRIGRRFLILPRAGDGPEAKLARALVEPLAGAMGAGAMGVCPDPRHETSSVDDAPIALVVPPKRAFGTGEHETTRQCLELLDPVKVASRSVLDLGTGSGILAMAAAKMGASRVVAIDEDPEAIEIARENLRLNGLVEAADPIASVTTAAVELIVGELSCLHGARFDLILANLYVGALEALAVPLAQIQSAGGTLIISGFSPADAVHLARAYQAAGFARTGGSEAGEWAALVFERRRS